jgi:hypothetical protein
MKAGKPDPHTCRVPALARRAHTVEEREKKAGWHGEEHPPFFSDGAEQARDVWALQVGPLIDNYQRWAIVDRQPEECGAHLAVCIGDIWAFHGANGMQSRPHIAGEKNHSHES